MKEARTILLTKKEGMEDVGFGFDELGLVKGITDELNKKELLLLADQAVEKFGNDFLLKIDNDTNGNVEKIFFRGRKVLTATGEMYALREVFKGIPTLQEKELLNLPDYYKDIVSHEFLLSGGLFLICGATGNGKSTTMTASMIERLLVYGGLGITVEDPPEYQMTGRVGNGYCFQLPVCVENGGGFADAIKAALRCYPSRQRSTILMIGEVRDATTAAEVLRDSLNGHLVFTTIHANNIVSGISRMLSLAAQEIGQQEAQDLMSHSLRVIVHQKIINNKPILKMLINDGSNSTITTRIKNGEVGNLSTEIMRQNNMLKRKNYQLPIKE